MTMSPLRAIDDFLYANVTRRWPEAKISGYTDRIKQAENEAVVPSAARRVFDTIDAKSAALLTHVSMMVAALGITATVIADSRLEQGFMIVQIMLYLLIAIACLRCSSLFRALTDENLAPADLGRELILRREVYSFCNTASIYLTIIVLVTLPILAYF
jgi:uncharacterized membrane protein